MAMGRSKLASFINFEDFLINYIKKYHNYNHMKIVLDDKARILLENEIALHEGERGALFISCEERRN